MSYETPRVKERSKELALMSNILAVTIVVALASTFIFVCVQVHKMNQQIEQMEVSITEMRVELDQLDDAVKQLQKQVDELEVQVSQLEERVSNIEDAANLVVDKTNPTYTLASAAERDYVERVVQAESGGESSLGQMYVATCIKNTAIHKGISALAVVSTKGQYTSPASTASASVKEAVAKVFDQGYVVNDEPVMYFYSTCNDGYSSWHENHLTYVCTIGNHRFFKLPG